MKKSRLKRSFLKNLRFWKRWESVDYPTPAPPLNQGRGKRSAHILPLLISGEG